RSRSLSRPWRKESCRRSTCPRRHGRRKRSGRARECASSGGLLRGGLFCAKAALPSRRMCGKVCPPVPLRTSQVFVRAGSLDDLGEALGHALQKSGRPAETLDFVALWSEEWGTVVGEHL